MSSWQDPSSFGDADADANGNGNGNGNGNDEAASLLGYDGGCQNDHLPRRTPWISS
jgi:hypothetical protein